MQRLFSYVTAASLTIGGLGLIGGCHHDKNMSSSDSGMYPADSARTSSGGTYDATGQNMGQNPPGAYGPGPTGAAGSSGRYGPGTAAPSNQNSGQGGYGNYGGVGPGSATDATGRPTGNTGSQGTGTGQTSGSAGSSAGGSTGGGGR
jgi:hypothetical protein